ncbi:hypothetical protein [Bilophila wadsworthia]|uniref:hypothetical protein n=1 Tax=Bilophila wadsworthia TaxID=35833 RepID=UPI003AB6DE15
MERIAAAFTLLAEVWSWVRAELAARRKALFRARVADDPVGVLMGQLGGKGGASRPAEPDAGDVERGSRRVDGRARRRGAGPVD